MVNTERFPIVERLVKWKATYELSFELTEIVSILLDKMVDYCKENSVPLHKERGMWSLVKKARAILKEIEGINSPNFKLPKVTATKTSTQNPDKLPESS